MDHVGQTQFDQTLWQISRAIAIIRPVLTSILGVCCLSYNLILTDTEVIADTSIPPSTPRVALVLSGGAPRRERDLETALGVGTSRVCGVPGVVWRWRSGAESRSEGWALCAAVQLSTPVAATASRSITVQAQSLQNSRTDSPRLPYDHLPSGSEARQAYVPTRTIATSRPALSVVSKLVNTNQAGYC